MAASLHSEPDPRGESPFAALCCLALLIAVQWLATRGLIAIGISLLPSHWTRAGWPYGYFGHFSQCIVALALIAIARRLTPFDFGLRWPPERSYVMPALWIGVAAGFVMLAIDNGPDLVHRRAPMGPYDPSWSNILPWLAMQGGFVGVTEEIPFRSLFLGFLLTQWHSRVRIGKIEVSAATIVTALIFSLAHLPSFLDEPVAAAVGQQFYVVALGIFYGWLFERSRSVLAPIVAHNAGDFVEWGLLFIMRAAWG